MRARVIGEGASAVVMVHGLLASNRYWDGRFDTLASTGRRVIAVDLLGFGPRQQQAGSYGRVEQARAVVALLRELGVSDGVTVVGHSFGGLVALEVAQQCPEQIDRVVMFAPVLYSSPESARRHITRSGKMASLGLASGALAERVCRWHCRHRRFARRLAPLLKPSLPREIAEDSAFHTWESFSGALGSIIAADAREVVQSVTCQVTCVIGDSDAAIEDVVIDSLVSSGSLTAARWRGDHHLPVRRADDCVRFLRSSVK